MPVRGGDGPRTRPSNAWFLANGWDKAPWYGNFLGPGPNKDPYALVGPNGRQLRPIDMLDAAAQTHDYYYNLAKYRWYQRRLILAWYCRCRCATRQCSITGYFILLEWD